MIFILDKQEKVINLLSNNGSNSSSNPFFNDLLVEDLATGAETFQFSTLAKGTLSKDLIVGNYIAFKKDKKYKLFQITQVEIDHVEHMEIFVYAECAGLSLLNNVVRKQTQNSVTLSKFLDIVTNDTDWSKGIVESLAQETFDLEIEDASCYSVLQNNIGKWNVEIEFRVEINNGRVSKKYIDTFRNRGKVTGKRFTFNRDIEGIKKTVDSSELYTALIGKGKNGINFRDVTVAGIDKPLGQDYVADQASYEKYNKNGYHLTGVFEVDSESPQEVLRKTYEHLQKCKEPKISYEIPVVLLGDLLGNEWDKVRIGDYISIFDPEFSPELMLMARVSKLETSFTDPQLNKCTLTNFVELKSNITDTMKKMASKLEGYVDSQFPIAGDKIQDGAIGQDQMNQEYMSQISADIISASVIQAERIVADEIEAVNGRFENIEAEHGNFKEITAGKIEAVEGKFNEINADLGNFKEISTDKISAVEGKFDKVQADLVNTNTIVAGLGEFDLVVTDRINAVDGKFETIKSELGDFKEITTNKLTATEGRIEELDSDLITTKTIVGNLGKFDDVIAERVDAVEGNFTELEAEVGKINTLVSGNITSDNIHSSGISSDKLTIRDGFIKNAMIDSVNASKINAGEINTNKVHITSENGGIVIADNTQQFKDKNGKVRIQMGQDAQGNFNFGVFDETGSGTLIDATGVKEKALADSIIKDRMIGQGEIGGNKINISSMIDEVNKESNTKTIKGSKVQLDTQGQTLDVAFNTLKTNLDVLEVGGINILLTTEKTKEIISNGGTNKTGASYSLSLPSSEIQGKDTRFQFKWEYIGDTPSGTFRFQTGAPQYRQIDNTISISENNTSGEVSVVWKPSTSSSFTSIGVRTDNMNGTLRISKVKLEKGTKETDWTPNPTEVAEKVESNTTAIGVQQGKIETLIQDTTIEKNGQSLKLKDEYSKLEQTVSGISSTVGSHTSSITNLGAQVDSKAKVFTSTPTVPYKVGDLWVQGSSGEIMKCKTARTTGSYNSSDWEKASKYTDDSKANQVESNLSNLSGKVTEVESKQATFKQDLDGFKQTVSNTYTTKTELSNTNKKVEGLTTTVENVSGSLETTKTQVAGIVTNLDSITQRVSSTETNVESVIETSNTALSTANQNKADIGKKANATDVYKKSETYTKNQTDSAITTAKNEITLGVSQTYETKTNVESKISTAMDNIQIGGRNLLKGTSSSLKEFTMTEWNCFTHAYQIADLGLKVGDSVAFKLYLKFENTLCGGSSRITFYDTAGTNIKTVQNTTYIKPNSEGYSEVTTVIPTNAVRIAVGVQREVAGSGLAHFKFQIKEPKLEQGTKCSSWTPAPEDVDSAINKKANSTDVYTKSEVFTKAETNSAINIAKEEINLGVSNTYETKANVETKVNTTLNSAKSYADTKKNEAINSAASDAANKVNSAKNELNTKIDGIQVGGRNLIKNSNKRLNSKTPTSIQLGGVVDYQKLKGKTITLSMDINVSDMTNVSGQRGRVGFEFSIIHTDDTSTYLGVWHEVSEGNYNGRKIKTLTVPNKDIKSLGYNGLYMQCNATSCDMGNVKLEEGNKATSWTPAPEDIDSALGTKANSSDVYTKSEVFTKEETNSQINIAKDAINLGVSQTYETKTDTTTKINNAVNGIKIGGTNLITKKSGFVYGYINSQNGSLNNTNSLNSNQDFYTSDYFLLKTGESVCLASYPKSTVNSSIKAAVYIHVYNLSKVWQKSISHDTNTANATANKIYTATEDCYIRFCSRGFNDYNHMAEYATKPSQWSPAPEDTATDIATAKTEAISSASTDATNKVNSAKTELSNTINNIQIGGRNLMPDSAPKTNGGGWAGTSGTRTLVSDTVAPFGQVLKATYSATGTSGGAYKMPKAKLTVGKTYSWSVWLKSSKAMTINVGLEQGGTKSCNVTTSWQKFTHTFTAVDNSKYAFIMYVNGTTVNSGDYYLVHSIMVEEGNKPSDWSPAPEDINADINKKANSTDVYTKSEVYTKTETNSQITATTNAITSRVSSLESKEVANRKVTAFRYVRDWLKGNTINAGNHWVELQVWANGSNIAQGKTVTTNGTVNSNHPINRFTDGNTSSSQYAELQNDNSWRYLQVDLREVHYNIDYLRVWHYYDDLRRYNHKLEVSVDGSTWYTIYNSDISGTYKETADGRVHIINETSTEKRLKTAESKITDSAIINTVSSTIQNAKNEAINSANSSTDNKLQSYATNSSLTQTSNSITAKFESSGGSNLVKNGAFKNGTAYWTKWGSPSAYQVQNSSSNGYGQELRIVTTDNDQGASQTIEGLRTGRPHTVVADVWVASGACIIYIVDGGTWRASSVSSGTGWNKLYITFTPSNSSVILRIGRGTQGTNGDYRFTGIRMYEGEAIQAWTPHHSEVYNGSTVIDATGLTVNNGALRVKDGNGNLMLEGDASGTLYLRKQLKVGTKATISATDGIAILDNCLKIHDNLSKSAFTAELNSSKIIMRNNTLTASGGPLYEGTIDVMDNLKGLTLTSSDYGAIGNITMLGKLQLPYTTTATNITMSGQITTPVGGALKDAGGNIFLRNNNSGATILSNKSGTLYFRPKGDTSEENQTTLDSSGLLTVNGGATINGSAGLYVSGAVNGSNIRAGGATRVTSLNGRLVSGWYSWTSGCTGAPTTYGIVLNIQWNSSGDIYQLAIGSGGQLWTRVFLNGAWGSWNLK